MRYYLVIIISAFCGFIFSQESNNHISKDILTDEGKEYNYNYFKKQADLGNRDAQNIIGVFLMKGWGCSSNMGDAIKYLEQAALQNSEKAILNLTAIYSDGIGVGADFNKAFSYLSAYVGENPALIHKLGYYYFKGLGCLQSYEKAISCFRAASEKEYSNSDYFLGICYKYGLGTDTNITLSNFYFDRAILNGNQMALDELEREALVHNKGLSRARSKNSIREIDAFKCFSGEFTGEMTVCDYGNTKVISKSKVATILSLSEENSILNCVVDDSLELKLEGYLKDGTIHFSDNLFHRKMHYSNWATPFRIDSIRFNTRRGDDTQILLEGQLFGYDLNLREPMPPIFLNMIKNDNIDDTSIIDSEYFKVYPNPIQDQFKLSFSLKEKEDVLIRIVTIQGQPVYEKFYPEMSSGMHNLLDRLLVPSGVYILQISKKSGNISCQILKK